MGKGVTGDPVRSDLREHGGKKRQAGAGDSEGTLHPHWVGPGSLGGGLPHVPLRTKGNTRQTPGPLPTHPALSHGSGSCSGPSTGHSWEPHTAPGKSLPRPRLPISEPRLSPPRATFSRTPRQGLSSQGPRALRAPFRPFSRAPAFQLQGRKTERRQHSLPLSLTLLCSAVTLGNDPTGLESEEFPAPCSLEELRETQQLGLEFPLLPPSTRGLGRVWGPSSPH